VSSQLLLELDELYGCWLWLGKTNSNGYPTWWTKDGPRNAHVELYQRVRGKVDVDRVLDHECRRRICVNPWHLDQVTQRENVRRCDWGYRSKLQQLSCRHDAFIDALRTPEGGKVCRHPTCKATQQDALRRLGVLGPSEA
jgi:hypothetical protein